MEATANTKWFGALCHETLVNWHEQELAHCKENAHCSRAHKKRMCEIIKGRDYVAKMTHKRLIAGLIAAALLFLAGCATYIYREKIFNFVAEFYEKYIYVTDEIGSANSNADNITEIYTLTYIPENFTLIEKSIKPQYVHYKWRSQDGRTIIFRQTKSLTNFWDRENKENQKLIISEFTVYHSQTNGWEVYLWTDGIHYFRLEMSYTPIEAELTMLINNVKKS